MHLSRSETIRRAVFAMLALALVTSLAGLNRAADASVLPSGFRDTVVLSGMTNPTVVQFAPDGRIFVGQKNGIIKVFSSLTDTSPVTFADLSTEVDDYWDRGLLGLALDPNFPTRPYVYVLYTYDAALGGTAPRWNDACPTPPGATTDGCVVSARVSKLTASGNTMTAAEQVLVSDWCQQFPSHSIGTLLFGRDGALYAGGGDGASFNNVDYGQYGATYAGDQANPCGDPPAPAGTALSPPTAEGGALRSQSVRRTDGPATLDGTIIRIDPDTGQAALSPTGCATRSGSPSGRAPTSCG
jgi:glucose/arabinose dehydrogenase